MMNLSEQIESEATRTPPSNVTANVSRMVQNDNSWSPAEKAFLIQLLNGNIVGLSSNSRHGNATTTTTTTHSTNKRKQFSSDMEKSDFVSDKCENVH
jgi:hypothetical protein